MFVGQDVLAADETLPERPRVLAHAAFLDAGLDTGSHDGLLDDSVTVAERLQAAGVPATLKVYPGAVHGFIEAASAVGAKVARQALLDCGRFIAAAVAA